MERETYETPVLEIIRFETEDVICTSGNDDNELPVDPADLNIWTGSC